MTTPTPRLGPSGRPILSLPAFRKAMPTDAPTQPDKEQQKPVEAQVVHLPRVLSEGEHAAFMADLALILGVEVKALPPVFGGGLSPKPLAKGIHEALQALFPAADLEALDRWLKVWTQHPAYQHRLAHGGVRYGLDGKANGAVEVKDKGHAKQRLHMLAVKSADQP